MTRCAATGMYRSGEPAACSGRYVHLPLQVSSPRTGRPRTTHQRDLSDARSLWLSARSCAAASRRLAHQLRKDAADLSRVRPAIAQQDAEAAGQGEAARRSEQRDRPNETWAMDFVHDQLATGRKLRVLTIVDTFSRFSPALEPRLHLPRHGCRRSVGKSWARDWVAGKHPRRPGHRVRITRLGSVGLPARRHTRLLQARKAHGQRIHRSLQRPLSGGVPAPLGSRCTRMDKSY